MEHSLEPAHLEVEHLRVGYNGHTALADVSFTIPAGGLVAVVGPNGAGKSTLFKALVGLLPHRAGSVRIHRQPAGLTLYCVAYVPQREEVDWRFPVTVMDVVMMGRYGRIRWFRRPSQADVQACQLGLEKMGIGHLARRSIGDLSGGQQQRVFLARALAQQPHILLLDEPFTGVDAATQEATLNLLEDLHHQGVTVIVSTHDLNMAATRFEQVLLLNRRVLAFGSPAEVFTPEHIHEAFSGQVLNMGGVMVVDQCCPPAEGGGEAL